MTFVVNQIERKTLNAEDIPNSNNSDNNSANSLCCDNESSHYQNKSLTFLSPKPNIWQLITTLLLFLVIYNLARSSHLAGQLSDQYFHINASQSSLNIIAAQNVSYVTHGTAESLPSDFNVTLIIQLSGELGNHISKIAKGVGIALWLQNEIPNLNVDIQLRRQVFRKQSDQNDNKWKSSEYQLHKCFPYTRSWNFSEANTPEINYIIQKLQENDHYKCILKNLTRGEVVDGTGRNILDELVNITKLVENDQTFGNELRRIVLFIDDFAGLDFYVDRYYDELRELFDMDRSCCNILPLHDEIVFHFRNFKKEMPKRAAFLGYEELTPQFIYQAMERIPIGTKVAIITRYDNVDDIQPFVDVLNKLGYEARILNNQTSAEDFCLLKSSQRGLLGLARSTFFLWASLLSDYDSTSVVQAYSIDSASKRNWASRTGYPILDEYKWLNPKLKNRFLFPLFRLD